MKNIVICLNWFNLWCKKRNAKRLYRKLWKANYIILHQQFGYHKKENKEFKKDLSKCSDAIESCIYSIVNRYDI